MGSFKEVNFNILIVLLKSKNRFRSKIVRINLYLCYMWDLSIRTDSRQSNVPLLYHIPWEFYNANYSFPCSRLQIRLEDNLVGKKSKYQDEISASSRRSSGRFSNVSRINSGFQWHLTRNDTVGITSECNQECKRLQSFGHELHCFAYTTTL